MTLINIAPIAIILAIPAAIIGVLVPVLGFFMILMAVGAVVLFVLSPIITLAYAGIEYIVAKLLGGNADFTTHFNSSELCNLSYSLITLPYRLALIPLMLLFIIPLVNCIVYIIFLPISMIAFVVQIYGLYYNKYRVFKSIHNLTELRAAAVVVLPVLLVIMLVIAIYVLAYASLLISAVGLRTAMGAVR
ncbi:hypothetical protein HZC07_02020 [Candidatus Micrarchaeota archaeon]|nr:hypothetical protein [Candidatus Micrarchaeota archaeon]